MSVNQKKVSRIGQVTGRSQVYNPATGNYVKRDSKTGQFIDVKRDGSPFKGVRKESSKSTSKIKANPNVNKNSAKKAENAVISVRNKRMKNE